MTQQDELRDAKSFVHDVVLVLIYPAVPTVFAGRSDGSL